MLYIEAKGTPPRREPGKREEEKMKPTTKKSNWAPITPTHPGYICTRCGSPARAAKQIISAYVCSNPGCDCQGAEYVEVA